MPSPFEGARIYTSSEGGLRYLRPNLAERIIGALTGKRIRHQGLVFDTRNTDFTPRVRAQMFWGSYEVA